jgi:hypothetical protein
LSSALLLNAIEVWFDEFDIDVGQNIHDRICEGLVEADFLGVVLTPRSLESAWVKEELSLAKQRELEERKVIILPLLFDSARLPLHLRSRKYADFTDFDTGFRAIMKVLDRGAALVNLDGTVRARIRDVFSDLGSDSATEIQTVRSQNIARIVRSAALPINAVDNELALSTNDLGSKPATVFVDIRSAEAEVPIRVDLDERSGTILARVLKAIGLDAPINKGQRFSFFLIYEGIPLELNETLSEAGILNAAHLQLGAFTYLIE